MLSIKQASISFILLWVCRLSAAEDFEFKVPLQQQKSGNFYVAGILEHQQKVDFLVDTGAGMVILAEQTFKAITKNTRKKPIKRMAARMADGRTKAIKVYRLEHLVLGQKCDVGPLEIAVIPGASNNILGLNVLKEAAPFAIYTSPPSLALSDCKQILQPLIADTQPTIPETSLIN